MSIEMNTFGWMGLTSLMGLFAFLKPKKKVEIEPETEEPVVEVVLDQAEIASDVVIVEDYEVQMKSYLHDPYYHAIFPDGREIRFLMEQKSQLIKGRAWFISSDGEVFLFSFKRLVPLEI
jgi:hypothetical protein